MAYYLYQATYTREAWAAQLQNPQNVADRARASVEELGGTIVGVWYAFGESDLIGVVEMPDNVSMAALAMAFAAGGAVSTAKTTVLMPLEDGLAAMSKAAASSYRPPAS